MRPNKQNKCEAANARTVALELLARREHSREELRRKLLARGYEGNDVEAVLEQLAVEGLQSDPRFAEGYVYARQTRGFGPLRIRMELQERGLAESIIDECLDERASHWRALLEAQYRKRYGDAPMREYRERARRGRFLQQRGFPGEMIWRLLNELNRRP